jgi:hypothetical protein
MLYGVKWKLGVALLPNATVFFKATVMITKRLETPTIFWACAVFVLRKVIKYQA